MVGGQRVRRSRTDVDRGDVRSTGPDRDGRRRRFAERRGRGRRAARSIRPPPIETAEPPSLRSTFSNRANPPRRIAYRSSTCDRRWVDRRRPNHEAGLPGARSLLTGPMDGRHARPEMITTRNQSVLPRSPAVRAPGVWRRGRGGESPSLPRSSRARSSPSRRRTPTRATRTEGVRDARMLSDAFRTVADTVRPSVVQIIAIDDQAVPGSAGGGPNLDQVPEQFRDMIPPMPGTRAGPEATHGTGNRRDRVPRTDSSSPTTT